MVVVGAPAGYGKTILLAQYAAVADRPVAWLSLDAADADPVLLALELATAIDRVSPVDARVFSSLNTPAPALRRVVLSRARQRSPFRRGGSRPGRPAPARGLPEPGDRLLPLRARPSRGEAPGRVRDTSAVPLGNLPVSGQLLELGWRDLALNRSEAEGLMRAAAPRSQTRTSTPFSSARRGACGPYLVALALRDAGEGAGSAVRVAGDDRDLVDYLSDELLTRLPPERLSFLLRTSVLDRISAPLCDAILGRQDSAQEIAGLVQSNLFVQPLDRTREWYRYHHLFRETLAPSSRVATPDRLGRSIAGRHGGTSGRGRRGSRAARAGRGGHAPSDQARGADGGRADPRRSPGHGSPLVGRLPGRRHRRVRAAGRDRCLGLRPVRGEGPGTTVRLGRGGRALARARPHPRAVARGRRGAHQGGLRLGGREQDERRRVHRLPAPPRRPSRPRARGARPRLQPDVARADRRSGALPGGGLGAWGGQAIGLYPRPGSVRADRPGGGPG